MKKYLIILLVAVLAFSMVFSGCKKAEEPPAVEPTVEEVAADVSEAVEEAVEEAEPPAAVEEAEDFVAEPPAAVEEAEAVVEEAAAEVEETVEEAAAEAEAVAEEAAEEKSAVEEAVEAVEEKVEEAVDAAQEAAEDAKEAVEEAVAEEPVEEAVEESPIEAIAEAVEEAVDDAKEAVEEAVEDVKEAVEEAVAEEPVEEAPAEEAAEEAPAEEPVEEPVEEAPAEEPVEEAVAEEPVEEAPAEEAAEEAPAEEPVEEPVEEAPAEEPVEEAKSYDEYLDVDWTEEFVDLSTGIRMAYVNIGPEDGTPIILLHGVTDGRVSWSQVAPKLAELGYHVIVPEYRGNGKTDKPEVDENGYTAEMIADDIVAFMDAIGLEKAHLGGHSYGSMISQMVNLKAPERLLSTILIDTTVDASTSEVLAWAEDGDGEEYLGVHGYDEEGAMPDSFLQGWAENDNPDESFQKATIEHLRQMPYECWYNLIHPCHAFNNVEGIKNTQGKVLVIWGTDDAIFPAADQDAVKAGLAESPAEVSYVDIPGSHNIHWDGPETCDAVVAAIDEFIKSIAFEAEADAALAEIEEAFNAMTEPIDENLGEKPAEEPAEEPVAEEAEADVAGILDEVTDKAPELETAFAEIFDEIESVGDAVADAKDSVVEAVSEAKDNAEEAVADVLEDAGEILDDVKETVADVVSDVVEEVTGSEEAVEETVEEAAVEAEEAVEEVAEEAPAAEEVVEEAVEEAEPVVEEVVDEPIAPEGVKVGIAAPDVTHGWVAGVAYYAEKYCKDNGLDYKVTVSSDAAEMAANLEDLVVWGADVIVSWPQWTGMETAIQEVIDAGIPVVNFDVDVDCTGIYKVTGDNYDMGYQSAKYITEKVGDAAVIAVLDVPSSGSVCQLRKQGFYDYLDEIGYDKSNIFESQEDAFTRDDGLRDMADLLEKYEKIDAVFSMDDETSIGAIQAITEAGRTDIKAITGGGGMQEYFRMIADEQYADLGAASALYSPSMVIDAIKTAITLLGGGEAEPVVVIPTTIVSADNVADYLDAGNTVY